MKLRHAALAAAIALVVVGAHQPAFARGGMGAAAGLGNGIGGGSSGRIPPGGTSGRIPGSVGVPAIRGPSAAPPLASPAPSTMAPSRTPPLVNLQSLRGLSLAPPPPPMLATPPANFQTPYTPPCGVPPLPQC